ncbi:MAG: hypothetical protein KGJ86_08270, partial [Chloroflexota bacterium]|nr:hypothetical protein [Chloroflexota bacterium]
MQLLRRFQSEQAGGVAVIVALLGVVLIGFLGLALDTGVIFVNQTQMQQAVDAAALAAAQDIGTGSSASDAVVYAAHNGVNPSVDPNTAIVTNQGLNSLGGSSIDSWQVTAQRTVALAFAPILGLPQATLKTSAVALYSPLASLDASYILPYAIWGGNVPSNPTDPWEISHNYAGAWCQNDPTIPLPCYAPARYSVYDYHYLPTVPTATNLKLTFRSNQWPNDEV